jgi:uncharacterized protein YkwD
MSPVKKLILATAIVALSCVAGAQGSSDHAIEDQLLSMMNQARAEAGLPALKADARLDGAASMHLFEISKSGEISDQVESGSGLIERLRTAQISCGSAGEIVLKVAEVDRVPDQLRTSESARRVLLNPKFSIAGVAQMISGTQLFIVADLAQPLGALSPDEVENLVVEAAQHSRESHKLVPFKVLPMRRLRGMACDMAKKDSLKVEPPDPSLEYPRALTSVGQSFVFTTRDPRVLPAGVQAVGFDPKVSIISVGVCFARSPAHPDGTYWVGLMFWAMR